MAYEYKSMTDEEVKQLAMDVVAHKVFGTWNVPKDERVISPFVILSLLNKEQLEDLVTSDIVHVYEYMDKASERWCNGMPMFMSARYLNRADAIRLFEACTAWEKAQKEFMAGTTQPT